MGLFECLWCITIPVSSYEWLYMRRDRKADGYTEEEIRGFVKVLDEVLSS